MLDCNQVVNFYQPLCTHAPYGSGWVRSLVRAAASDFLFGNPTFPEHSELLKFQHRFLIGVLLICVLCTLCALLLSFTLVLEYGFWLRLNGLLITVLLLLLWRVQRARPQHMRATTWALIALVAEGLAVNNVLNAANPLTFLWAFSAILPTFVLLGRRAGWLLTGLLVAAAWAANLLGPQPLSTLSMYTVMLTSLCLALQCHFYVVRFQDFWLRLHSDSELLRLQAQSDPLTGVRNAAAYYAQCDQVIRMAQRAHRPFAVLFMDLDHFKLVNDTHGHAAGDAVLRTVARSLLETVRETDVVGRVGGEEFSILLPDTDLPGALDLAERIRAAIEGLHIYLPSRFCLHVTASLGVAISLDAQDDIQHIQGAADQAMYRAKAAGRNRVSLFTIPPPAVANNA